MKKILLTLVCFLFLSANCTSLKGGISEEYIPDGFFGSWGVISKLDFSNNPSIFNFESRDIWTLSGRGNILILENLESGAHSEIEIKDKSCDNKTLKFERTKTVNTNNKKIVYKETVTFRLMENNFSGTDKFVVENYDEKNNLIKTDIASYNVAGIRISGRNP